MRYCRPRVARGLGPCKGCVPPSLSILVCGTGDTLGPMVVVAVTRVGRGLVHCRTAGVARLRGRTRPASLPTIILIRSSGGITGVLRRRVLSVGPETKLLVVGEGHRSTLVEGSMLRRAGEGTAPSTRVDTRRWSYLRPEDCRATLFVFGSPVCLLATSSISSRLAL